MDSNPGASKILEVRDLGRRPFQETWEIQKTFHRRRRKEEIPDTLLFVEHDPVYTLGKNANEQHVIASDQFLDQKNIEVVQIDRGGDVTYHGPGQIVGYPIFHLKDHRKSISWYMRTLEQVFIDYLKNLGHTAGRKEGKPGVWIEDEKILAVGVRIARWVTMHGFALNVGPDLEHFQGIIPCGISEFGVTSLEQLRDQSISPDQFDRIRSDIVEFFVEHFGFTTVKEGPPDPVAPGENS